MTSVQKPTRLSKKQQPEAPDPYDGSDRRTIPMPLSVEDDSETVWQDFRAADEMLEFQFAKTDFTEIKDED